MVFSLNSSMRNIYDTPRPRRPLNRNNSPRRPTTYRLNPRRNPLLRHQTRLRQVRNGHAFPVGHAYEGRPSRVV
ncbi:hypothetical protein PILCRDRAFT_701392 [Piloderma croceum F 1598]|uniref:Uncharacterized protein n=1 Tax=Piloderma croceum (strain F 1598) TaxID=765440 RepID=A0A0C3BB56_PILCF|nr:hypothetical protein PILCRDRAFT_701392 [Piloderma croceum F 1598]